MQNLWLLLLVFIANLGFYWCIPSTIDGEEVFGRYFNGPDTPDEDVQVYFQECPVFKTRLDPICHSTDRSCRNRCGNFTQIREAKCIQCSCDVFCTALTDCCWDYETECPEEKAQYERTFAHFKDLNITCDSDHSIINGPLEMYSEQQDRSITEAIVSDLNTGLNFRGLGIFKLYFNQSLHEYPQLEVDGIGLSQPDLAFWSKSINSKFVLTIDQLQRFMDGSFNYGEDIIVTDEPPVNQGIRGCKHIGKVHIDCSSDQDEEECKHSGAIQIDSLKKLCTMHFARETFTASLIRQFEITTIANDESQRPPCPKDYEMNCKIKAEDSKAKKSVLQVAFSLLFTFNEDKGRLDLDSSFFSTEFSNTAGWKTLSCDENIQNNENCQLIPICEIGFILLNTECRKPKSILVEIVGQANNYELFGVLQRLIDAIVEPFQADELVMDTDWPYETNSNTRSSSINATIILERFTMEFEVNGSLPFSDHVSTFLRKEVFDIDVDVNRVQVCFEMEPSPNELAVCFCEMYHSSQDFSPQYFEITGPLKVPILRESQNARFNENTSGRITALRTLLVAWLALRYI